MGKARPTRKPAELAIRIKSSREALDISQEAAAERLGVDKTTVSHWELGIAAPRRERFGDVSKLFGIPLAELHRMYIEFRAVPKPKAKAA